MHDDEQRHPGAIGSKWTAERKKPKKGKKGSAATAARVGELGTIGQCLPGDLVACESLDGKRFIWLEIAWHWPDGKATQVRIWDHGEREISCRAPFLRTVQTRQRVRWLGVRRA